MRSPISNVVLDQDVPCTVAGDVRLSADIYRPSGTGRYPVLLMRLPYNKRIAQSGTFSHPSQYAAKGYVVVVQDTRGRWGSEGEFYPFLNEGPDGAESIEWAASLEHALPRVGMYGFSYAGAAQLLAAAHHPPSLRTICPSLTSMDIYQDWFYPGGVFSLAFAVNWSAQLFADDARQRGDFAGALLAEASVMGGPEAWLRYMSIDQGGLTRDAPGSQLLTDWRSHPERDGYWRNLVQGRDYSDISLPALHVGGLYDTFAQGSIAGFSNVEPRDAQRLVLGPWHHQIQLSRPSMGLHSGGPGVIDSMQLRWFGQFLHDEDTGVLDGKMASVYVTGENAWVDIDWPPECQRQSWYLDSGGMANSKYGDGSLRLGESFDSPADIFTHDPLRPVPSAGGNSCCTPETAQMGPKDQDRVERSRDVLVYSSAPLADDVLVIGAGTATIWMASSSLETDIVVKLCDVDPEGTSVNIQQGRARVSHHGPWDSSRQSADFEPARVEVEIGPLAHRFRAGHRLRVQVASSDFPNMGASHLLKAAGKEAGSPVATQTVFHDTGRPSRVNLPVVSG